jgi:hypothetical protein
MRGEATNLSPAAKGLLLSLIACQDQFTRTISWSKAHLADISSLDLRTVYYALKELTENNWITRNHQIIQLIITTQTNSEPQTTVTAVDSGLQTTLDEPQATISASADAHNQDQIDLKDPQSERKAHLILSIAERYQFPPSKCRQLYEICKDSNFKRLSGLFESMINSRKTIRDPLAYITTSLGNNGHGQQEFNNFLNSLT